MVLADAPRNWLQYVLRNSPTRKHLRAPRIITGRDRAPHGRGLELPTHPLRITEHDHADPTYPPTPLESRNRGRENYHALQRNESSRARRAAVYGQSSPKKKLNSGSPSFLMFMIPHETFLTTAKLVTLGKLSLC